MKNILTLIAFCFTLGFVASCNNANSTNKTEIKTIDKTTAKEYTFKYICPMHCEGSGSDKMGVCPVCKMDYELNEDYKGSEDNQGHEGHDHGVHDEGGHDHGHDHGSHEGHNH